jgi:hypothetical protein
VNLAMKSRRFVVGYVWLRERLLALPLLVQRRLSCFILGMKWEVTPIKRRREDCFRDCLVGMLHKFLIHSLMP